MFLHFYPTTPKDKCLVLVGGLGDTVEIFQPLVNEMSQLLPDHSICTFDLSPSTQDKRGLLEVQTEELKEVFKDLTDKYHFSQLDIWCTSMGAYATTKLMVDPQFAGRLNHVIFFDPAAYYLTSTFGTPGEEVTWSGHMDYQPREPVVSDMLTKLSSNVKVDVVHLTVRNHSSKGYIYSDYGKRGEDTPGEYPRLNTEMVKKFYSNLPDHNKGKYVEVNHLPHGFVRDGDIGDNLKKVAQVTADLLAK